jgi:membrane protease YdiL (CAAX protease family)
VRRRRVAPLGAAPVPPAWSGADGYALFVRGLAVPQALALVALLMARRHTAVGSALAMAADLPLFWWVARYVSRMGGSTVEAFGLRVGWRAWPRLVGVSLALIAAALLGDVLIQLAANAADIDSHWTEGFWEDLLWAPRGEALVQIFDATIWAPIVEELTFRGLLYGALRSALGMWPAALVSAVVFMIPHGYAISGSASVLVSGLLWAVAYERTRSLWPGLLAHSANNVLSTLWTVCLLR